MWVELSDDNARRVWDALQHFGAPIESLVLSVDDFLVPGTVVQLGVSPRRIDLLTSITGVEFPAAWDQRMEIEIGDVRVPMIGRAHLLANKLAVGRPQDLADAALLRATGNEEDDNS